MSDIKVNGDQAAKKENASLKPLKDEERSMKWASYLMLWLGGCISIGTLTMGSAQLDKGLNLLQIFLAVLIGSMVLIVGICLNDAFSYRSGAPYAIQLKSAYGTKGSIVPVMIRGLPAIVWYGFQSWLGGSAINQIAIALFGYSNVVLFFLLFQALQIALSVKGFQGIKWVENIGGAVIVLAMFYMFYICITQYGSVISTRLTNVQGTWGLPFIAACIAFFGNSTTVMLNAGDYSRELKQGYSVGRRGAAYFLAMVPATVMLGLIGAMASTATGIANPINAFAQMVDNKFLMVITLCFILFAQMTTNLASNVVPPSYAFMDAFKMKHRTAVILVGVLAICTCPWILTNDASAAGLDLFVKIYTAFFGPIFAVLITDFYILHERRFTQAQLADLYDDEGSRKGVNKAAIIATAVGAVIGIINVNISFLTATIPTALVYYFCMKKMPSCQNFRKGTRLE
ncbi:NCS1 family transporter [Pseudoramibacter faecis]|uniref:NCS1 family transporter n=1 Tax=Pseudoramibacter faecis TaxID=3108534 RepID=UPI002E79D12A|nr:NCS1 family transporter [Pseudoramibacter sp. HA2172]